MTTEPAPAAGWRRLHPLSPVARIGRIVPVIVVSIVLSPENGGHNASLAHDYLIAFAVIASLLGIVHWFVTRWSFDGETLRIETGLIRHDSRRLPLARIQAVDVVRPLFARILGLSELRVRLAGSGSTDGKLAYLSEGAAFELRDLLLAGHRVEPGVAEPAPEGHMAVVGTGRLAGSIVLSGLTVFLVVALAFLLTLDAFAPKRTAAIAGALLIYLVSIGSALWRRLAGGYHFEATEVPEGIRVSRGLMQTVSETVPLGRVQAVRRIEPMLWRPLGWCRVEVDVAGAGSRNQRGEGSQMARKALLPVGSHQDAWHIVNRVLASPAPPVSRPPKSAMVKAPLSYHYLAAGYDEAHAMSVTGRLRKVTTWAPLEKSQSIRRVEGPLQRALGLASVHLDVAGRRVRVEFRDRSSAEADLLVDRLTELSRAARMRRHDEAAVGFSGGADVAPPGWYPDPTGRHAQRYFNLGRWTDHVGDNGALSFDPLGPPPPKEGTVVAQRSDGDPNA